MTKTFCDLCGQEILYLDDKTVFRIKKIAKGNEEDIRWREKLIVHDSCWKDMCDYINTLRTQRQENNN